MKNYFKLLVLALVVAASGCGGSDGGSGNVPTQNQYVYVLNQDSNTINQFRIGTKGALVPLSPAAVATGSNPVSMSFDQTHAHLYAVNQGDHTISQFTIQADGTLAPVAAPIDTGEYPLVLTLGPGGTYLYSVNYSSDTITQFLIGDRGVLSFVKTIAEQYVMNLGFSPTGLFAYMIKGDTTVGQFSVNADGGFTPLTPPSLTAQACPSGPIAVTRAGGNGQYLYVLSCFDSAVEIFSIAEDGRLTSQAVVPTGTSPKGMTISGSNLYVANRDDSSISIFHIEVNGGLTLVTAEHLSGTLSLETLALDPTGEYAYVIDLSGADDVLQFEVNSNGTFTAMSVPSVPVGTNPSQILVK